VGPTGHGGEEKNSQSLPALEPPIIQPVAQRHTTELSRLLRMILIWMSECEDGRWFKLAQDRVHWRDLVLAAFNFRILFTQCHFILI
jgi:hypothetical protein